MMFLQAEGAVAGSQPPAWTYHQAMVCARWTNWREFRVAALYITHDLAVVATISNGLP